MNVGYLACGGWIAAAVAAAAEFGVADRLEERPQTAEELAAALGVSSRVLVRLLRVLAMTGVFAEDEDGRFSNTEDSRDLLSAHPASKRHFCMLAGGMYQRAFNDLAHALRTGEPAPWKAFGGSIYEHMDRTPDDAEVYDGAMEDLARHTGPALAQARSFETARLVMDIGGGRGTLLRGLLGAQPHLRGILVDREPVVRRAAAFLAVADPALAARIECLAGDFFEPPPARADVYILKNVLHNWNDESAGRILTAVRAAMEAAPDARLLVIEPVRGGGMQERYMRLDDLLQAVVCEPGAVARSADELAALVEAARLRPLGRTSLQTGHLVLEAAAG